jgi:hypothetical protein
MIRLSGVNMDIDLCTPPGQITCAQDKCLWNADEGKVTHRCAIKNVSICKYFRGIEPLDSVVCAYPDEVEKI